MRNTKDCIGRRLDNSLHSIQYTWNFLVDRLCFSMFHFSVGDFWNLVNWILDRNLLYHSHLVSDLLTLFLGGRTKHLRHFQCNGRISPQLFHKTLNQPNILDRVTMNMLGAISFPNNHWGLPFLSHSINISSTLFQMVSLDDQLYQLRT